MKSFGQTNDERFAIRDGKLLLPALWGKYYGADLKTATWEFAGWLGEGKHGSVIVLRAAGMTARIGVRQHTNKRALRYSRPPTSHVDVELSGEEFASLVEWLERIREGREESERLAENGEQQASRDQEQKPLSWRARRLNPVPTWLFPVAFFALFPVGYGLMLLIPPWMAIVLWQTLLCVLVYVLHKRASERAVDVTVDGRELAIDLPRGTATFNLDQDVRGFARWGIAGANHGSVLVLSHSGVTVAIAGEEHFYTEPDQYTLGPIRKADVRLTLGQFTELAKRAERPPSPSPPPPARAYRTPPRALSSSFDLWFCASASFWRLRSEPDSLPCGAQHGCPR